MAAKAVKAGTDQKKIRLRNQIIVIGIIVVLFIISNFFTEGKLFRPNNIRTILTQVTYPLMVGLGMMFIFTTGMIDLSVGAQVILAANVGAIAVQIYGLGYPGLIIGTVVTLIITELLCTSCSLFLKIPSWVAGLGCALVFEALGVLLVGSYADSLGTAIVQLKECKTLGSFPVIFIIAVVVAIIAYFIFNRTRFGFNLRAIGGGGEVAEAMGINRKKTIIMAAVIGAVIIAIGGITQLSYTGRFTPTSGMGSLSGIFKSLAVVLIAGSFSRIFNDVVGCAIGAFIVAALFNVLTLLGVPSGTGQDICLGIVVMLCGILSALHYKGVQK